MARWLSTLPLLTSHLWLLAAPKASLVRVCSRSNGTNNNNFSFSSAQSHPFNAFSDFNHAAQHLQGEVGLVLKVESNSANSSPNDFGQKSFTDARRASTDPSSPQLNNVNLVPPSACTAASAWA
ncbi:hypothetical protein H4Q26_017252 [Puccinia striiformis f. sp. tritici PST-130]|nr:hypothetical protein H4Q26_017252 [Puccinia striiformis f. sp. tritici PST-130]